MRIRWLGWAGIELEADGATLVIDPLADPAAVFAPLGERAAGAALPAVVPPRTGTAVAALVTHLHRDHADAAAITGALTSDGVVVEPPAGDGEPQENLALLQADAELAAAGLERRRVEPWTTLDAGPFRVTALPAVDGLGDPQLSWLVEADACRVLHLGDTLFHGFWWRFAQRLGPIDAVLAPVNGALVSFPHRRPASALPATMTPEQAAVAAAALDARVAIPIHGEGYEVPGVYASTPGATGRFAATAGSRARIPQLGETIALEPVAC